MNRKSSVVLLLILAVTLLYSFERISANGPPLLVNVSTDKAVYNPGEDVHIKAEVRDGVTPVSGATVGIGIVPPGGPANMYPAAEGPPPGDYFFTLHLPAGAKSGVWSVSALAQKAGYTDGSDSMSFQVVGGAPPIYNTNWMVFNPGTSPPNPTTEDPVRIEAWLQIAGTLDPMPQTVEVLCFVDGTPVGGGPLTVPTTPIKVYTPLRKYSAGLHTGRWIVDPNMKVNDIDRSNNEVFFQFSVSSPAPKFDFSLVASPASTTVVAGETASFTITATLTSGTAKTVNLEIEGLPPHTTHTLSEKTGNPTFSSTLTITTEEQTTPGSHTITIKGSESGGGLVKTTTVNLVVSAPPEGDFEISASPLTQKIVQGQSTEFIITVVSINDFEPDVVLSIRGLPSGASEGVEQRARTAKEASYALRIDTTETVSLGSFTIVIKGEGGGKTHETTCTLMIEALPQKTTTSQTSSQTTQAGTPSALERILSGNTLLIAILLIIVVALLAVLAARRRTAPAPTTGDAFCIECGTRIAVTAKHCPNCGAKQKRT